jgi:LemA protein
MVAGLTTSLLIVFAVVLLVAIWIAVLYNRLVTLRNRFKNAFAQIDVQLKRRYDLIPNLVETVKGYLRHERETLEAVVAARNRAVSAEQTAATKPGDPKAMRDLTGAEAELSGALARLLVVVEAYPDLKASERMGQLMEELSSTENKVSFARQAFNDAVTFYNTARETFPAVLFAGALGFSEAQLLEIEAPQEREAPKVTF